LKPNKLDLKKENTKWCNLRQASYQLHLFGKRLHNTILNLLLVKDFGVLMHYKAQYIVS